MAYLPASSWMDGDDSQSYHDALRELVLPLTKVLVGNQKSLTDFLLPDWDNERPSARELAWPRREAGALSLVTGIQLPNGSSWTTCWPAQGPSPARSSSASRPASSGPATRSRPRWPPDVGGRRAARRVGEALSFLDQSLDAGFRPGMGNVVPDRFFWALPPARGRGARRRA